MGGPILNLLKFMDVLEEKIFKKEQIRLYHYKTVTALVQSVRLMSGPPDTREH